MSKKIIITSLVLLFVITGCKKSETANMQKSLVEPEKKVAVLMAPYKFSEEELGYAIRFLERDKRPYDLVSIQEGVFKGPSGKEYSVKKTASELKTEEYSSLVVVGGEGMAMIASDDSLNLLVNQFGKAGKKVAGIGQGNQVLQKAIDKGVASSSDMFVPQVTATSSEEAINQIISSLN
ncbi:DJ-1/PfpI family protein [Candidatus Falkowbacteria bacterium]|nr:DJ-1/PfpI family protein [Candidatus Falkowbacteria bacterium]